MRAVALLLAALLLVGCGESPGPLDDRAATPTDETAVEDEREEGDEGVTTSAPPPSLAPALEQPEIGLRTVAAGLTSPVALADAPDDTGRLFVVDQIGLIRVIDEDGELVDEPFLDLREQIVDLDENYDERGLLGLAFHPDYAENGRFFVYYSAPLRPEAPQEWNNTTHVSEFRVSAADPLKADPGSEKILMRIDEPQSNHAGGTVAFGPDGYLYVSLGDGGAAADVGVGHPVQGNGQDTNTLLGSILRIDVDSGDPYGIPPDNPFANGRGQEEIYAYGFRNPYRFSFDQGGENQLFVGDAGQNLFEEVSIVERGGNYGWRIMEGTHCFDVDDMGTVDEDCPPVGPNGEPLLPPVIEYSHDEVGVVVVGGHVYRGTGLPELDAVYVFGDFAESIQEPSGTLLGAVPSDGDDLWAWERIGIAGAQDGELGHYLLGFGQDAGGEMYVLVKDRLGPVGDTGQVLQMVPPEDAG